MMRALLKEISTFRRRLPSPPHTITRSGFTSIDFAAKVEEERLPHYDKSVFYPVRIGDVYKNRYQVLSKLGFGANSTVWFCRDLR